MGRTRDFSGKGDKVFVAAAVALHADEPVLEVATTQVVLELGQDKAWQRGLVAVELTLQAWQILLGNGIKRCVFWSGAI